MEQTSTCYNTTYRSYSREVFVKSSLQLRDFLCISDCTSSFKDRFIVDMVQNYGISIGINGYAFSSFLQPLKYAKKDADLFASFYKEDAGFDEVWIFSDDSRKIFGESTTPYRTNLLRFFRNQFDRSFLSKEDSLWLFFSGHGIQHGGIDYVLPIDGDPEDPRETGISLDWIVERTRRSGAGEIVLIVDICRIEGRKGPALKSASYEGITTIFSCKPTESSWEIDEPVCQGAFTHVLVENLRKQINDKLSSVQETEAALQKEILSLNRKYGKLRQTPHIRCEYAEKAISSLFSPSFIKEKKLRTNDEFVTIKATDRRRFLREKGHINVHLLKKAALEAEEAQKLDVAKDLWEEILKADVLEQSSYIEAITRIAETSLLKSLNLSTSTTQAQSSRQSVSYDDSSDGAIYKIENRIGLLNAIPAIRDLRKFQEYRYSYPVLRSANKDAEFLYSSTYCLTENIGDAGIDMVAILGGTFCMGSSEKKSQLSELPKHEVSIDHFLMGKYPVTKQQWKAVAMLPQVNCSLKKRTSLRGSQHYPVVDVSWYEAVEFCDRLSAASGYKYRLPTEAEWEYACRSHSTTPFYCGKRLDREVAWFDSEYSISILHKFPPNAFGLHNMHGTVWEWCIDHWHKDYTGAPSDGSAWLDSTENPNRVQRGGSWRNEPKLCRSACRVFDSAISTSNNTGFRIVRSLSNA